VLIYHDGIYFPVDEIQSLLSSLVQEKVHRWHVLTWNLLHTLHFPVDEFLFCFKINSVVYLFLEKPRFLSMYIQHSFFARNECKGILINCYPMCYCYRFKCIPGEQYKRDTGLLPGRTVLPSWQELASIFAPHWLWTLCSLHLWCTKHFFDFPTQIYNI
jgi:hypothetical protein